ncbi:MAG: M20/M25/M40 family metallo-hydrolase [Oscillospiraceae bacterium]|nr:M20/M25/M40 family metallo-hydrolase [Oscillospiraceae bacterium]
MAVLLAGTALGLWQVKPPRADGDSPAYRRMMSSIQRLTEAPHPNGSAEIGRVRADILAEIESMGVTPLVEAEEVTELDAIDYFLRRDAGMTLEEWWAQNKDALAEDGITRPEDNFTISESPEPVVVYNILAKLDAPGTDKGVMFVSHYDSAPGAPGAADDMAAVCAMLEALREQSQNGALRNDLYFLFTDGEEEGMLGAWEFVTAHPEMKDMIELAVNLESRGNSGAVLLFETSPKAYGLVSAAVKSGAKPVGTSWAAAVYAMMPNYTDLTAFLYHGYAGINFAAVEGVETYHMPSDTYENLNRDTAWQYLQTTLALSDYAARSTVSGLNDNPREGVYFPFLPGVLILISAFWSYMLGLLACGAALAYIVFEIRGKRLKITFTHVLMGLLLLLSAGTMALFPSGSYLFYIPLLMMAVTAFLKRRKAAHILVSAAGGIVTLLLWVPVLFLLWVTMIQPMML